MCCKASANLIYFFSLKCSALKVNFLEWSKISSKGATFLEHKLTKVLSKTLLL
uniref:Uncharacterized protein n=1 Tax=Physcomitrium patens TaxID=3218 RepID=A0A2K1KG33_PHYPA|nr:hypothetical protein PHYPA_009119 [Physcomitrium patens]